MDFTEKTINEKAIYKGKIVELIVQEVELHNGSRAKREIVKHSAGVAVLAFKDKETVIFVEQYRKPFDKLMLELPAGKVEDGENPEDCGKRELEEETGYKARQFIYLGKIITSPGFCSECVYLYKAINLFKGKFGGDEDEFIKIKEFKITEVREMIKRGDIEDAKTIAAFMHYFNDLLL